MVSTLAGSQQIAKEASKSQGINKSAELKFEDDPCTTIADEESEELPDESTDECKDYVKKFNDDRAILGPGIQKWSQTLSWAKDDSHKVTEKSSQARI